MDESQDIPAGAVELAPNVWVRPEDLRLTFMRSGGPGGQHVNKTNTKAELRVAIADIHGLSEDGQRRLRRLAGSRLTRDDEILIQSEATRSQRRNREDCLDRLHEIVLKASRPPKKRKKTRPGKAARERRLQEKQEQSEKKRRRRPPPSAGDTL